MWKSLFGRGDASPEAESAAAPEDFAGRMRASFDRLRADARRAGGRLPVAALPLLGRIEDIVGPLLDHLDANPPTVDEQIPVEALLTDYLPTAVNAFIRLNPTVADRPGADGRTPGDALLDQLALLEEAAHRLSVAIYSHDAQQLETHGRFLATRFSGSDL